MVLPDIQIIEEDSLADGSDDRISQDNQLADLQKMFDMQAEAGQAQRESQITAMGGNFDINLPKYQDRLQSMIPQPKKMSFFDLASELGAGLLSTPNTGGASAYMGLGVGFTRASEKMKKQEAEQQNIRQQIAMKAFELAQTDEKAANDFLNQALLASAKNNPDSKLSNFIVTTDKGVTVDGKHYTKGMTVSLTETEAINNRSNIVGGSGGGVKVPASGQVNLWQTREGAEKVVQGLGLLPNMPNYEQVVNSITASSDSQVGTEIIRAGQFTELRPLVQDGVVTNIMVSTISGGTPPPYIRARDERLKSIAKSKDGYAEKVVTVLPSVERAMTQILSGVETGTMSELTLPFKQIARQIFGTSDPALAGMEDIMAISNYLAPKMRPVGSGSTSDMEFKAYQNALLALGKTPEANYIALYAFKKMTENSIRNNKLEEELLTNNSITNMKVVNETLYGQDIGIFEKLPTDIDPENEDAVQGWFNSLPKGAVIDNSDGVFESDSVFIIKDWNQKRWSKK